MVTAKTLQGHLGLPCISLIVRTRHDWLQSSTPFFSLHFTCHYKMAGRLFVYWSRYLFLDFLTFVLWLRSDVLWSFWCNTNTPTPWETLPYCYYIFTLYCRTMLDPLIVWSDWTSSCMKTAVSHWLNVLTWKIVAGTQICDAPRWNLLVKKQFEQRKMKERAPVEETTCWAHMGPTNYGWVVGIQK